MLDEALPASALVAASRRNSGRALQDDDGEVKVSHRAASALAASSHDGTRC